MKIVFIMLAMIGVSFILTNYFTSAWYNGFFIGNFLISWAMIIIAFVGACGWKLRFAK